ncbi:4-amino-4-deoxy-L-arabinose-phosphoundecaprenol flippase subunit ArnF [Variovorax sp. PBS-H4]|uniref:DMT family transporter n=1 Tax=Variovorax sp. PBS-H4 TaxID=434008 RepID=UPI001317EB27|nr:SMR family transporter [Variovorax sp. PBS-H4]VTU30655.1 4-amino-4-deoxy-L-arabinose-phosphoundecaprenol flippase subunit ArnF [Variovorax sp. PBS-H4]
MRVLDFLWVLSGVLLNAFAQLLLKAGANSVGEISMSAGAPALWRTAIGLAQHPGILGGLACYVVSVVVWIVALSRVDVSIAYPMLSIGYVVNAALAWWLFGENVNAQRWLGIGVIVIGVLLVANSGSRS